MPEDPKTPAEWQEAADGAEFSLPLDSARQYGPADGWRKLSVDGSADMLAGAPMQRIRQAAKDPANLDAIGYPSTLVIKGDIYDRQGLLPREGYPGIPYARRADTGGQQLLIRVEFIECPACGRQLRQIDPAQKISVC